MAAKIVKDRAASADGSPDGQRRDGGAAAVPAPACRKVAHLTPYERIARGEAARNEVPRSTHGRWAPAQDRPDPVALLEEQGKSRVSELVPVRYGIQRRMGSLVVSRAASNCLGIPHNAEMPGLSYVV